MAKVRLSQECIKTEFEISGHDVAWHNGAGPFVTLFRPYARLFAQDPSLKGADLRLLFYILSLIGKDNGFLLDRKTANEMIQMKENTISRSIKKLIQRRIILKDGTRNAYHLSMDRLALNNRVACKCSAVDYSNEHTPLLLSEDCSYSELPILIHSSKYVVRKLTVAARSSMQWGRMRSLMGKD